MTLELYLQNRDDGTIYDISDIAETVQVEKSVDGTARQINLCVTKRP